VAVTGSDCVLTDVWVSMSDEKKNLSLNKNKQELMGPYRVTQELMSKASEDALFMHCLPAHRGEEVDAEVIEGEQSVVWSEVENRLHVQKSILVWCCKD
jgi:Ornithine carbamoyltransferase